MSRNKGTIKLREFAGINNTAQEEELKSGEFREADDVYVTNKGKIRTRDGFTQLQSGNFHSLYENYVCKDMTLYRVEGDLSLTAITTLSSADTVSYTEVNGTLYFTNGIDRGRIKNGLYTDGFSVSALNHQPDASVVAGGLPDGKYQLVVTGVVGGMESSCGQPKYVELTSQGGISVTNFPDLSMYDAIRIYLTYPNGEVLYLVRELANSAVSYLIGSNPEYGRELQTQFKQQMMPGSILREGHGRLWVTLGNFVGYSEPLNYGLTDITVNYFGFPSEPTIMEPVLGGVWVVADHAYFLSGTNPKQMQQVDRGAMTAVRGTAVRISSVDFMSQEVPGDVIIWTSDRGIVAGLPNGELLYLTEGKVDFDIGAEGAAGFVQGKGADSYVSVLKEPDDTKNNFAMSDRVVAEVRRNGVVI